MSKQTSQKPQNLLGANYGLLNFGVHRVIEEGSTISKTRSTYQCLIVRSKVNENGDISEFTELVDPDSLPHPLAGVVYDPATMSMTAQLAAGVELKPVHLGSMYSDPLEAERIALRANSYIQKVVATNEELKQTSEPVSEPAPEPAYESAVESKN